jgi:hypothetical protein
LLLFLRDGISRKGAALTLSASKLGRGTPGEGGTMACSEPIMILAVSSKAFWRGPGVDGAGPSGGCLNFVEDLEGGGVLGRLGLTVLV